MVWVRHLFVKLKAWYTHIVWKTNDYVLCGYVWVCTCVYVCAILIWTNDNNLRCFCAETTQLFHFVTSFSLGNFYQERVLHNYVVWMRTFSCSISVFQRLDDRNTEFSTLNLISFTSNTFDNFDSPLLTISHFVDVCVCVANVLLNAFVSFCFFLYVTSIKRYRFCSAYLF